MNDKYKYADAVESGAAQLHDMGLKFQTKVLNQFPMASMVFEQKIGPSLGLLEVGRQDANDVDELVDGLDPKAYEATSELASLYQNILENLYITYEDMHGKFPTHPLLGDLKGLTEASYQFWRLLVKPLVKLLAPENEPIPPFDPDLFFWEDYGTSHWEVSPTNPHTGVVGFRWGSGDVVEVDVGANHFPLAALLDAARQYSGTKEGDLYLFLPGGEFEGNSLAHDNNWRDAPTYNLGWLPRDRTLIICGNGTTNPTWFREATDGGYGQTLGLYGDRSYLVYDINLIASRDNALNIGKYGNFDPALKTHVRWVRGRMVGPRGSYRVVRPVSANACSAIFYGTYFNFGEKAQEHVFYYRNPFGDCGMVDCLCDHYGAQRIQAVSRISEGILYPTTQASFLLSIRSYGINGNRFNERAANIGVSAQGSCQNVLISGGADMDVPEAHVGADEKNVHGICNFTSGGSTKSHKRTSGKGQGLVIIDEEYVCGNVDHDRPPIQGDSAEEIRLVNMGVWGKVKGASSSRALEFTSGVGKLHIERCNKPVLREKLLFLADRFGLPGMFRSISPDVRREGQSVGSIQDLTYSD